MPEPIDPAVWELPGMRVALAHRDIAAVYKLLTGAGVSQRRIAELTGMGASEVSEVLVGRRVMAYDVLARIADGLDVPRGWMGLAYTTGDVADPGGPADGPYPGREEVDEDVKRRAFLAAASVALFGRPVLGELLEIPARPDTPTPLPARLGAADVETLRALTEQMRSLARTYGGQGETVAAVASRGERLLSVSAAEPVRRALGSALAEMHTVAGWCCFDTGADDAARAHFARGLELASEVGDTYRMVNAIYHAGMATQHVAPNDALKLFQLAQSRIAYGGDHPRAQTLAAWLHIDSARALAMLGERELARSSLAAGRDQWSPADRFDQADMDHVVAQAHLDLGLLDSAEHLAASSVRAWTEQDRRDGVQAEITLAQLHVQADEPDGLDLARRAIAGVAQLRSTRARARLAPLAEALAARPGSESRELAAHARRAAALV